MLGALIFSEIEIGIRDGSVVNERTDEALRGGSGIFIRKHADLGILTEIEGEIIARCIVVLARAVAVLRIGNERFLIGSIAQ